MPRVKSHDLSQEDVHTGEQTTAETTPSPLGAGLPLLQRLRLLKEKQEHEERASNSATPLIMSPSPSSLKSPPPVPEEPQECAAGLPLLQRILQLKSREDHMTTCSLPTSPTSLTHTQTTARSSFSSILPSVATKSEFIATFM